MATAKKSVFDENYVKTKKMLKVLFGVILVIWFAEQIVQ
jgi:hypothetical protein